MAMTYGKCASTGGMMRMFIAAVAVFAGIGSLKGATSSVPLHDALKGKTFVVALKTASASGKSAAVANGYAAFTVAFSAQGRARVSGTLPNGSRISSISQMVLAEDGGYLPVVGNRQNSFGFQIWFDEAGRYVKMSDFVEWKGRGFTATWSMDAKCAEAGNIAGGSYFNLDSGYPQTIDGSAVVKRLLPINVPVTGGTRWSVPKAERVKLATDGTLTYGVNPANLRLTYAAKTGTFKGSFALYTAVKGRLRKKSASVVGVVVDGVGYGTANVRNVGSWPVKVAGDMSPLAFDASSDPIDPASGSSSGGSGSPLCGPVAPPMVCPEKCSADGMLSLFIDSDGKATAMLSVDEVGMMSLAGTVERLTSGSILSLRSESGGWLRFSMFRSFSDGWMGTGVFSGTEVCRILTDGSADEVQTIRLNVFVRWADGATEDAYVDLSVQKGRGDFGSATVSSESLCR